MGDVSFADLNKAGSWSGVVMITGVTRAQPVSGPALWTKELFELSGFSPQSGKYTMYDLHFDAQIPSAYKLSRSSSILSAWWLICAVG